MTRAPNGRERKALMSLSVMEWENRAQIRCGDKVFSDILLEGWIEQWKGNPMRDDLYCITDEGRAALKRFEPKEPARHKLRELPSRLGPAPSRLDDPRSRKPRR